MKPALDKRKCPAQSQVCTAIPACLEGAILYVADETVPLGGRIVFDYEKCNECGLCVTECCGGAVELI
jgi:Pyruvate/2-oxoacid:ferredoxin oxidoreductase delta subunit